MKRNLKKLPLCVILIISMLIPACVQQPKQNKTKPETEQITTDKISKSSHENEIRGVWITCYELPKATLGKKKFKEEAEQMMKNLAGMNFNVAYIHVRANADSIYPSKLFPTSRLMTGEQGGKLVFDPLEIILKAAKDEGIKVEAWINPFRVSSEPKSDMLAKDSQARTWLEKKSSNVIILDNGIYFNPASHEVQKLVLDGVREILKKYDVAGIHIDDYFYPSQDEKIDSREYEAYRAEGGTLSLSEWRRAVIDRFVASLYSTVKIFGTDKTLSISPAGSIDSNINKQYADVFRWAKESGYADIIIPQIYFGFHNEALPFEKTAKRWAEAASNSNIKIVWGLGIYKSGKTDEYAGKGINEWVNESDIITRQIDCTRALARYNGYALFSYSYIFFSKNSSKANKNIENEVLNFKKYVIIK